MKHHLLFSDKLGDTKHGNTKEQKPGIYIEVVTTISPYTAQHDDELTFDVGENIYVILMTGDGW